MNAKDLERVEELRVRAYAQVAANYLREVGDPHFFDIDDIEDHRGRQKKAVRLLEEAGIANISRCMDAARIARKNKYRYYHSGKGMRIVNFEDSRSYGEEQPFSLKWEDYRQAYGNEYKDLSDLFYQGYKEIPSRITYQPSNRLHPKGVLFAYWNKHLYDFHYEGVETPSYFSLVEVFPKRYLTDRMWATLRANVETRLNKNFQGLVEWALDVPKDSYNHRIGYFFPRDYFKDPSNFNAKKFEGTMVDPEERYNVVDKDNPYIGTLLAFKKDLLNEIEMMEQLAARIATYGGYEAVLKKIRQHLIEEIVDNTPLEIMEPTKKVLAEYIMNNLGEFTYEKLYLEVKQEEARVTA